MTPLVKTGAILFSIVFLSACGGGSTVAPAVVPVAAAPVDPPAPVDPAAPKTPSPRGQTPTPKGAAYTLTAEDQAGRVFAKRSDGNVKRAGGLIAEGRTLKTRSVSTTSLTLDKENDATRPQDNVKLALRKNEHGELNLTINGVQHKFTASERQTDSNGKVTGYVQRDDNSKYVSLTSRSGELDEFLFPGNGHHEILEFQTNQVNADGTIVRGFAIFGAETKLRDLKKQASATYHGDTKFDARPRNGFYSNRKDIIRYKGKVKLEADFGAGVIWGEMYDMENRGPFDKQYTKMDGRIDMEAAAMTQNAFEGVLTPDATFKNEAGWNQGTGVYRGSFYGPNGESVAGTIVLLGKNNKGDVNSIGYFQGEK